MLKKQTIVINEVEFEVQELSIGSVLPLLPKLEIAEEQQNAQMEIMKMCIMQNGKAMGEEVSGLGIKTYLTLAEAVMEINGLRDSGKD